MSNKKTQPNPNKTPTPKRPKSKKWIFWCALAVAFVAVIVAIVNLDIDENIPDDYFASDDTKLVLSTDSDIASYDTSEYEPPITRIVYYYNGNRITNLRVFFDYDSAEDAEEAYQHIEMKSWASSKKLNGKYIIFTARHSEYEDLKTSDIRANIKKMKATGALLEE